VPTEETLVEASGVQELQSWGIHSAILYEGCPASIRSFQISRESVVWPWCNLAASQRRPYSSSVNSHSPVGLVSRQWDAVDWACVFCDRRIHNDWTSTSASSRQCTCPFYSSRAGFLLANHHFTQVFQPPTTQIFLPATSGFSQSYNRRWKGRDLWMRRSHSTRAHSTTSHCRLTSPTGDWLYTDAQ
jgi:hypothetical protein